MKNLYKTGDKVLLYSLEECKLKPWYCASPIRVSPHRVSGFNIAINYGFITIIINYVNSNMIYYLGSVQIIKSIKLDNFIIYGTRYVWTVQLIKEKIS